VAYARTEDARRKNGPGGSAAGSVVGIRLTLCILNRRRTCPYRKSQRCSGGWGRLSRNDRHIEADRVCPSRSYSTRERGSEQTFLVLRHQLMILRRKVPSQAAAQRRRPADLRMALSAAPVCRRRRFRRTAPDRRAGSTAWGSAYIRAGSLGRGAVGPSLVELSQFELNPFMRSVVVSGVLFNTAHSERR
jgi:hypothetical protein